LGREREAVRTVVGVPATGMRRVADRGGARHREGSGGREGEDGSRREWSGEALELLMR
jgi:hypothetical protein